MSEVEKLPLTSLDVTAGRIEQLRHVFPEVFREGKIDNDALLRSLGEWIEPGKERFGLNWPGKAECMKVIQSPSVGTLLPMRDESVNFDTSGNLIIEGDNLEVLKLLQRSYYGKVKMIYIDPPYNTGNEFIYPDNYREGLDEYLRFSGQVDEAGYKLSTNTESEGRYHSKWLSMMYPRLFLARNLLRDDGVIFVSIDDNEVHNLRALMNEVFGEEDFLGCIAVVSNLKGRSDDKFFATAHNSLLTYSVGSFSTRGVPIPEEYWDDYPEIDENGHRFRLLGLRKRGSSAKREDRARMYFPIYVNPMSKKVSLKRDMHFNKEVLPKLSDGSDGRWRWGKETVEVRLDELMAAQVGNELRWDVFQIDFAEGEDGVKRIKPKSFWMGSEFSNESGTLEVKRLLGKGIFDNPKPIGLLTYCMEQSVEKNLERTTHDFIDVDSNVERTFAERLDNELSVKLFMKLPRWFKVDTPIGAYNPDWAILFENEERIYMVRETKDKSDKDELRDAERKKVECGEKHFAAIGVDYRVVTNLKEALAVRQSI